MAANGNLTMHIRMFDFFLHRTRIMKRSVLIITISIFIPKIKKEFLIFSKSQVTWMFERNYFIYLGRSVLFVFPPVWTPPVVEGWHESLNGIPYKVKVHRGFFSGKAVRRKVHKVKMSVVHKRQIIADLVVKDLCKLFLCPHCPQSVIVARRRVMGEIILPRQRCNHDLKET